MIEKLRFYLRHSINDLRVNGQRTVFALLCVAAGVAAIVSLQTLGGMVKDTLTSSLQESNGGDLQIAPQADKETSAEVAQQGRDLGVVKVSGGNAFSGHNASGNLHFTPAGLEQIQAWFAREYPGSVVTQREVFVASVGMMSAASISDLRTSVEQGPVTPYLVDASAYPLYGSRSSEDGQPLSALIQAPTDVVISRNLADTLDAQIGDTLHLSGTTADFTLRGIIPTDSEGGMENMGGALFGYYFVDLSAAQYFDPTTLGIDRIFVKLPDPSQVDGVELAFDAQYPYLQTTTTSELKDQNTEIADTLNQLVMVMGLVSLLIGGIGIVNTMQVVVSRRTTEVAVLKTLGLEGPQVTVLFLVEAVLMGFVGSLLGIALGWLTAYATRGIAGAFIVHTLDFRITPGPALTGLVVGVVVTAIFGFMPTLAAGEVRPNLVLHPNDAVVPRAGRRRSFAALLVVMAALSLVAQPLLGDLLSGGPARIIAGIVGAVLGLLVGLLIPGRKLLPVGLAVVGFAFAFVVPALLILSGTFVIVGLLYALLWGLVWVVARFFPSGWLVDLKVALRSMLAVRGRVAATLLALVVGVFTLSLVTMLAQAITDRFESILVDEAGGNVIVFASGQGDTLSKVEAQLQKAPGVNSYTITGTYNVELISMEDVSAHQTYTYDELKAKVDETSPSQGMMGHGNRGLSRFVSAIDARGVNSNLPDVPFYRGRQLTADDAGKPYLVVTANDKTLAAGFDVGDRLTFRFEGGSEPVEQTFEIVGMMDRTGGRFSADAMSPNYAPLDAFPAGLTPDSTKAIVDVQNNQIAPLRQSINTIPGAFMLETRLINDLINRLIDQFTSFPILVASLALIVGGIVIANSVALSTLERRREIGIMKAVGLQRERVLGMLLLENGLMGLIGGLIGVGLGSAILLLLIAGVFGGTLGDTIPYLTALSLMALCVGIALLAAVLTAWGASGEKPLNVLRYE